MALSIPQHLAEKAAAFPESSHGANRVTLVLSDARRIHEVSLAWGSEIVRIGNRAVGDQHHLGFALTDIVDVESEVRG